MNKVKACVVGFFSALASWLGILAIPVVILILCNIIDYATGIVAAKYRGEKVNSYKGFRGIAKKVCMWLLVAVGAIVDWLLIYAGQTLSIDLAISFVVACIVAIWLIANEIISILENIKDIGGPIPPFLLPFIKNIKSKVEKKAELLEGKNEDSY